MPDWIFLSHALSENTPMYGNREGLCRETASSISHGQSSNSQKWSLPNHIGTHVDVSRHFFDEGISVDRLSADYWIFSRPAVVDCQVEGGELIGPGQLERSSGVIALDSDCLLLRTGFERFRGEQIYWENNPGLHPDLAAWVRQRFPKIRAIGMDTISVTSWRDREAGRAAHRQLLAPENPFLLIEDMSLVAATRPLAEVIILPLRLVEGDGGPATVIGKFVD